MKRPLRYVLALHVALAFSAYVVADEGAAKSAEKKAAEKKLTEKLDAAKHKAAGEEYELRYKFEKGETIKAKVTHLASTDTTIRGNTQTSRSRSVSTKVWKVMDVTADGNATFEHSVEKVEMWQSVSGRKDISYNSETDKEPPAEYVLAASTIGVPLARVTVDPSGEPVKREDLRVSINIGLGQITTPLPKGKVKIGTEWHFPTEITTQMPDGRVKVVKTRQLYTLESVETDIATISVKTQVLTPVNDPQIESQLVQQLTNGEVKFDIEKGRVVAKQMDWDETVIGFGGPESTLKYLARFTEELLPAEPKVAAKP